MKTVLPAIINPPRIRKDKSCSLSFDSRELSPEEMLTLFSLAGSEGWLAFSPNQDELDVPDEDAALDTKTPSQRLRSILFVLYKQRVEKGTVVGLFQQFYDQQMEKIIDFIKTKLDEST